jgi:hypothetical protein
MWMLGSPMRIHWGKFDPNCPSRDQPGGMVDIPVLSQLAEWRSRKIWGNSISEIDFDGVVTEIDAPGGSRRRTRVRRERSTPTPTDP